ncbi:MAG: DUF4173 domain-containing protein [Pseudonocardiales bacterium]|nr:DUF4173 domain-containing protein [Pseudonocardiales bacterium]
MFGERWTGPPPPPSRVVLGAAVAAAVVTAVAVPEGAPGLGWPVTALVLGLLAAAVRWHARPAAPNAGAVRSGAGWGALAVGLAAVSALRDAEWLVTLCLLAAVAAGSLAVAGRAFRSTLVSALVVWVAAARALPWVVRGLPRGAGSARIAVSALACGALLLVFVPLLASADAAFAAVVGAVVPALDGDSAARTAVLAGCGAAALLGASYLLVAPPEPAVRAPRRSPLRPLEWALPLGVLAALFAAFTLVQVVTLLGGDDHVRATTGLTYAEYARTGFWQLIAVTVLALGVILVGQRLAPDGRRAPLAVLAVLTLGIVATAIGRMWLYEQAYGSTVLRLVVLVCELWLGAGFVLVLVGVVRGARPVRGMVVTGAVMLLALALADPERIVAERNVDRFAATGSIDLTYLSELSADAAPALARLPEPQRSCALAAVAGRVDPAADDWRSLNAARAALPGITAGTSYCAVAPRS